MILITKLRETRLGTSPCSVHAQHTVRVSAGHSVRTKVGVLEEGAVDKLLVGE